MDAVQAKDLQTKVLMEKSDEAIRRLLGPSDLELGIDMVELQVLISKMLQDLLSIRGSNV